MKLLTGVKYISSSNNPQEDIHAKVIGVLKYNNKIRENLLNRNIGKYVLSNLNEGIGYISNLYSNEFSKPTPLGDEGLLGFTQALEKKLINQMGETEYFANSMFSPYTNYIKSDVTYTDYIDYLNNFFGLNIETSTHKKIYDTLRQGNVFNFEKSLSSGLEMSYILADFIKYDNIHRVMDESRIPVIRPNPQASLEGKIITNWKNESNSDSTLGIITNIMYSQMLYRSSQLNDLRRTKYITPDAYHYIGLKGLTFNEIDTFFKINKDTGRLSHDITYDIQTKNYESMYIKDFTNPNSDYFDTSYQEAYSSELARYQHIRRNIRKYSPFKDGQYEGGYFSTLNSAILPVLQTKIIYSWNEGDKGNKVEEFEYNNASNSVKSLPIDKLNENTLLKKTSDLFSKHSEDGIDTLVNRFHTSGGRDKQHNAVSLLQSAVSAFGMSHGRNLLSKKTYETSEIQKINGYENPYCRTWTAHHQYGEVKNLITTFLTTDDNGNSTVAGRVSKDKSLEEYNRREGSCNALDNLGVLSKYGFVNITPSKNSDGSKFDIRNVMFSIENLAWKNVLKDENVLHPEQVGPLGGRIMWFPPYNLKFTENVMVNWSPNEFIGRGEKIYTYSNTERGGTLSFTMLVDHPSKLDIWKNYGKKKNNNIDDEQNLLRYFAGCDNLEILSRDYLTAQEVEDKKDEYYELYPQNTRPDYCFYAYFPFNFDGTTDGTTELTPEEIFNYLGTSYEGKNSITLCDARPPGITKETSKYNYYTYNPNGDETNEDNYCNSLDFKLNTSDGYAMRNEHCVYFNNIADHAFVAFPNLDCFKKPKDGELKKIDKIIITSYYDAKNETKNKLGDIRNKLIYDIICYKVSPFVSWNVKVEYNVIPIPSEITDYSTLEAKLMRSTQVQIFLKKNIENDEQKNEITTKTISKREQRKAKREQRRAEKKNGKLSEEGANVLETEVENSNIENVNRSLPKVNMLNTQIKRIQKKVIAPHYGDAESEYFKMLEDHDSLIYDKTVEKIKFFSPAFHSISPEGFNSRLSFLHQCTRQGPTVGVSDREIAGAFKAHSGNMAFGQPPICVLRIGDFYYTKIIINSITIDYGDTQWDLNPEGIGVQPIFANININFWFTGGSDIGAPISRLQNAVSFNYYANQRIYDMRADIPSFDANGNVTVNNPWSPDVTSRDLIGRIRTLDVTENS